MNIIDRIGNRNPEILLLINSILLLDQKKYLGIYLFFFIIERYLNEFSKKIIKEPRPIEYANKKYDDGNVYLYPHTYGMPSGHSSLVFYSTTFLWLVKKSTPLLIFELFMCAITLYQRYKYKKHTIQQLFGGAILGSIIAFIGFHTGKKIFV